MNYLHYKDTKTFGHSFFFPLVFRALGTNCLQVGNFSKKDAKDQPQGHTPLTLDDAIRKYGNPDESILVDATRANESEGNILVYRHQRIFIIAGEPLKFEDITNVSSYNSATPYTFGQYQILLTTKLNGRQYIRLDAGHDAEWAQNVAMEIIDAMK